MYWKSRRANQLSADLNIPPQNLLCTSTSRGILRCALLWWSGLHLQLPQVFMNTKLSWITGHVGSDNICFYTHLLWGNLNWQNSYCYKWMRSHRSTQRGMRIYPLPHTSLWFHTTLVWHPEFGLIAQLAFYTCNTKRTGEKNKKNEDLLRSMHRRIAEPRTWRQITAVLLKHTQKHLFNDTSVMRLGGRSSPRPFKVKRNFIDFLS